MKEQNDAAPCCSPARHATRIKSLNAFVPISGIPPQFRMVTVPGGSFEMGSIASDSLELDGEGPVRTVYLDEFDIDATAVTVEQFSHFIAATGHETDAERYGWSFVFTSAIHPRAFGHILEGTPPNSPWWRAVEGASWRHPDGPGSDWRRKPDHPVVHVSWNDAVAFAASVGKRLPTEAEWEKAARGGLLQTRYPWGNELLSEGQHNCNIWQGLFPEHNTCADGYLATAPVKAFKPNGFGLYNTIGNVWEWCADGWSANWHVPEREETRINPAGPLNNLEKVIKGGSYLCHASYCNRYRLSGRSLNSPDSSTGHMGFRCAAAKAEK